MRSICYRLLLVTLLLAISQAVIANEESSVLQRPLLAGQVAPLRWKDDRTLLHDHMYRVGLPPQLRPTLLEFATRMNISNMLADWTTLKNGKPEGYEDTVVLKDDTEWFLQRPGGVYSSDMHWVSPHGPPAQESFLSALSAGGFDDTLQTLGHFLGLDSLTVFQVTFLGVSHCTEGYVHWDTTETDGRAFVMVIPVQLAANETTPELYVKSMENGDGESWQGLYKYEYDVGILMGDDALHGTAPVDYRDGSFRIGATIYMADITEDNAESVAHAYSQSYPPPDDTELILSWKGMHWNVDDSSESLPRPGPKHVLYPANEPEL